MKKLLTLFITLTALISKAQVEITGTAKNYNDTFFYISEPGGFQNFTRAWRGGKVKITINKNGHFKAVLPEIAINTWYIETDKGNQFFDLIKGEQLELIADFSQPKPLLAIKRNADNFNYSSYVRDSINKYYKFNNLSLKIRNNNIDSVLYYRKQLAFYKSHILNSYKKTHKISDIYYKWLISQYSYQPYERTLVENITNKDSVDDKTLLKIMEKGIHDEYAALNTTEYNDLISFYIRVKYKEKNNEKFSITKYFNFVANSNLITGYTKIVFLSRLMYSIRTLPDSIYILIFKNYDRIVSNRKIKQYVIDARSEYNYKNPLISKGVSVPRSESIEEVIKSYKGKVIYADFWASWCIPCLAEMPNSSALEAKLKRKDIIFLYFGYKDIEQAWLKARNQLNIKGEHYLLTEKMVNEADRIFGINGIPHYAIIDKNGSIVSKSADRPKDVYQQLLKLIEK